MTREAPALIVVETLTLHDGEPMHWWAWEETPRPVPAQPAAPDHDQ